MQRRSFIKDTALTAMAVSAAGYIRFNGTNYIGDCETTTDILGPFYRPGAPVRSDMRITGDKGQPVVLTGQVKHKDCKTPLKGACVELWHCSGEGVYDNDSPDFKYRARTYCDEKGNYAFKTVLPVPYDAGNQTMRPAHFHLLISAEGYQSLVTQLYFTGDPNLSKDPSSASPAAKARILEIKNDDDGGKKVLFDITMMEKLPADKAAVDRLSGSYTGTRVKSFKIEFFNRDNQLWYKDKGSINGGYPLIYSGDNTFDSYGHNRKAKFEIKEDGSILVSLSLTLDNGMKNEITAVKEK